MNREIHQHRNQLLYAFLLLLVGTVFLWTIGRTFEAIGAPAAGDLKRFWAAGGVLASHQNPYDIQLVSAYAVTRGAGATQTLPLYYPPMAFSVLLPLSYLSFEVMRVGYLACVGGLVLAFWIVPTFRHFLRSSANSEGGRALLALSSYLLFLPGLLMWWVGALTAIPLFGLLLFFIFNRYPDKLIYRIAAGACIALTLVKPTVCILVPPYLLTVWLRRRAWSSLLGFTGAAAILLAPVIYLWQQFHLSSAANTWKEALLWRTSAPMRYLLEYLELRSELWFLPALFGISFVIWRAIRRCSSDDVVKLVCLVLLPLGFLLTPFAWTYDFAVLFFTIAYIFHAYPLASFHVTDRTFSYSAAIAVMTTSLLLWCSPLSMELHAWYPIGICIAAFLQLSAIHCRAKA